MAEENAVIKKKDELSESENQVELTGKILTVTSKSECVDVDGILTQLFQYANIGDALVHVDKQMKYVVQIPLQYKKAFEAGELLLNQNSKTGVTWPTLYEKLENGKRRFVGNLPIE